MKKYLDIAFIIFTIGWFTFIGFGIFASNFLGETKADLGFNALKYSCELKNGIYKVLYDKAFLHYPKFEFEIKGNHWTEIRAEEKHTYELEKIGKTSFRLNSLEKETDSLTQIQKALISQGKVYYQLTDCKNDTIGFIMRASLHVISHSGKFVRIK